MPRSVRYFGGWYSARSSSNSGETCPNDGRITTRESDRRTRTQSPRLQCVNPHCSQTKNWHSSSSHSTNSTALINRTLSANSCVTSRQPCSDDVKSSVAGLSSGFAIRHITDSLQEQKGRPTRTKRAASRKLAPPVVHKPNARHLNVVVQRKLQRMRTHAQRRDLTIALVRNPAIDKLRAEHVALQQEVVIVLQGLQRIVE